MSLGGAAVVVHGGRRRLGHDERVVTQEGGQVGNRSVGGEGEAEVEMVARVAEAKGLAGLEGAVHAHKVKVAVARVDGLLGEDVSEVVAASLS